jgi:hypothetical protein
MPAGRLPLPIGRPLDDSLSWLVDLRETGDPAPPQTLAAAQAAELSAAP